MTCLLAEIETSVTMLWKWPENSYLHRPLPTPMVAALDTSISSMRCPTQRLPARPCGGATKAQIGAA